MMGRRAVLLLGEGRKTPPPAVENRFFGSIRPFFAIIDALSESRSPFWVLLEFCIKSWGIIRQIANRLTKKIHTFPARLCYNMQ